jgi:hypothetical protein
VARDVQTGCDSISWQVRGKDHHHIVRSYVLMRQDKLLQADLVLALCTLRWRSDDPIRSHHIRAFKSLSVAMVDRRAVKGSLLRFPL